MTRKEYYFVKQFISTKFGLSATRYRLILLWSDCSFKGMPASFPLPVSVFAQPVKNKQTMNIWFLLSSQSDCFYNAGWTKDIGEVVNHLHQQYIEACLFVVGTSIGANVLLRKSFLLQFLSSGKNIDFILGTLKLCFFTLHISIHKPETLQTFLSCVSSY